MIVGIPNKIYTNYFDTNQLFCLYRIGSITIYYIVTWIIHIISIPWLIFINNNDIITEIVKIMIVVFSDTTYHNCFDQIELFMVVQHQKYNHSLHYQLSHPYCFHTLTEFYNK